MSTSSNEPPEEVPFPDRYVSEALGHLGRGHGGRADPAHGGGGGYGRRPRGSRSASLGGSGSRSASLGGSGSASSSRGSGGGSARRDLLEELATGSPERCIVGAERLSKDYIKRPTERGNWPDGSRKALRAVNNKQVRKQVKLFSDIWSGIDLHLRTTGGPEIELNKPKVEGFLGEYGGDYIRDVAGGTRDGRRYTTYEVGDCAEVIWRKFPEHEKVSVAPKRRVSAADKLDIMVAAFVRSYGFTD